MMQQRNVDKSFSAINSPHPSRPAPALDEHRITNPLSIDRPSPLIGPTSVIGTDSPEKIGPYRIAQQISLSARSSVFSAVSLVDGRSVMMKFPNGWGTVNAVAAKRQFRALRRLQHPGIVNAIQLVNLGNRCALVTEKLQRRSLLSLVRRTSPVGTLPDLTRFYEVASKLLLSLDHMHSAGWIHGSIQADHVLFNAKNEPVWIDFSNATFNSLPFWCPPDKTLVDSSPYLAPELICAAPSDPASDMFAIGRLFAYLLTGSMPRWFPGEAIRISDHRLRAQMPPNTPSYLLDLCARLVRMSPIQRPTAAMVLESLKHQRDVHADADTQPQFPTTCLETTVDSAESSWQSNVCMSASKAFSNASKGRGSVQFLPANSQQAATIGSLYDRVPCDDARLILSGVCDSAEQTPLPGFDSLLDLLAQWFDQLTPALRGSWQERSYPNLYHASSLLHQALGQVDRVASIPDPAELHKASDDILRLLTDLSRQRTLVLILHQVEQMDAASSRLLCELAKQTVQSPIIIVATTNAFAKLSQNPHLAPLVSFAN